MSRLIVKNLPKYFTEDNLRDHFAKKYPNITDVKLMKTRQGESRRFAFLGFKDPQDAEGAVAYFNNSFIHTSRITVHAAKSFADPTVPKPMKEKLREQQQRMLQKEEILKEAMERKEKSNKRRKLGVDAEIESNPRLREFLEATKHSSKVRSWDDGIIEDNNQIASKEGKKKEQRIVSGQESDDEYQEFAKTPTLRSVKEPEEKMVSLGDFEDGGASNKQEEEEKEVEQSEEKENDSKENDDDEQMVSLSSEPVNENISDLEWLQQRKKLIKDTEAEQGAEKARSETTPVHKGFSEIPFKPADRANEQQTSEPELLAEPEKSPEEKIVAEILQTGRLFIRNILYTATEADFATLFEPYGTLEEVHIAIDTRTHKSKGFVYIQFQDPEDAVRAYRALDKEIFQGRLLHILPGQVKKSHRLDEFDLKNLPLKKQKELKRKFEATKATFSWNSLFLNENAVLEAVADKIGVSKRDLIDPESSSSAVKQALAEAHVIGDVRKYFETKGIDLTSFSKKDKDDKVVLAKNFPYGTTMGDVTELFSPYGELNRVLVPPGGAIAIAEFKNAPAGRAAFTKLAYRRFKKNILYLEKGPKDLFTKDASAEDQQTIAAVADTKEENVKDAKLSVDDLLDTKDGDAQNNAAEASDAEEEFAGITTSVFVKNLNFKTTSQELSDLFKPLDGFIIAKVSQKPDSKNPGKFLSMGFGFIEFKTKEQALDCIKKNDGKVIDGHKIQLKISHRKSEVKKPGTAASGDSSSAKKSTKIIVKNLPFEATRKDVFELFNSFGHLKSVRVPRKFNKSARGFAFVEFNLAKEAEHAMDALRGVHLLGRRLNIDYAEKDAENAEEEVRKMTVKMKKQQGLTEYARAAKLNGKRRVELEDEEGADGNDGF